MIDSQIIYSESFADKSSLTISHNQNRQDFVLRLVVDSISRPDLLKSLKFDVDSPTNIVQVFFTETISGRIQLLQEDAAPIAPARFPVNFHEGGYVFSDYEIQPGVDEYIGAHTGMLNKPFTIWLPDISTIDPALMGNIFFSIYKISGDANEVCIRLRDPEQAFVTYSAQYLTMIGDGVEARMDRNGRMYWFIDISSKASRVRPQFTNLTPVIDNGALSLKGIVDNMGSNDTLKWCFRYRKDDSETWTQTSFADITEAGEVSDTVTGLTEATYQSQMIVRDFANTEFYSTVLACEETERYYMGIDYAVDDGAIYIWQLQEHSANDEPCIDLIDEKEMKFYNSTTYGSDTVSGATIYKREFGDTSYGEAKIKLNKNQEYTILMWIDISSTTGDHTILSLGKNKTSLAVSGGDIQLAVDGDMTLWEDGRANSTGFQVIALVINPPYDKTSVYSVTPDSVTLEIEEHDTMSKKGSYIRLGRGAAGDAHHQDYEYMGPGAACRTLAVFEEIITSSELMDMAANFERGGLLL